MGVTSCTVDHPDSLETYCQSHAIKLLVQFLCLKIIIMTHFLQFDYFFSVFTFNSYDSDIETELIFIRRGKKI